MIYWGPSDRNLIHIIAGKLHSAFEMFQTYALIKLEMRKVQQSIWHQLEKM